MLSFWEKESFLDYNTIIVGSGIVGLSAAISLKEETPEKSVLILERGLFPTGASTRNAGFACFGSLTEVLYDLTSTGADKTLGMIEKRIKGLAKLRKRLGDTAIQYEPTGGYELISEKELPALTSIELINDLLHEFFPDDVYTVRKELIEQFGFNRNFVQNIVYNPYEGQLHTGKLMQSLLRLAREKGVEIYTGVEVVEIEENENEVKVYINELSRGKLAFYARQVAICTNAFTKTLLPATSISPGRGQIILTKPIKRLPWEGTFHFDEGFYYFRNVGTRVLFGGGRNLAFEEENTTQFQTNPTIISALERLLQEIILPGQMFEIEQYWSGIMGFSTDKQPIVKKLSPRLTLGFACNGMGVSLASAIGDEISGLMTE